MADDISDGLTEPALNRFVLTGWGSRTKFQDGGFILIIICLEPAR